MDDRQCCVRQQGTVLFMALIFLILTTLVATTAMSTAMLLHKMAGNGQLGEDNIQVTEGIANEVAMTVLAIIRSGKMRIVGNRICTFNGSHTDCAMQKKAYSSSLLTGKVAGDTWFSQAYLYRQETISSNSHTRLDENHTSQGLLLRYIEAEAAIEDTRQGFSQNSIVIGIVDSRLLAVDKQAKNVQSDVKGSGSGSYRIIH